MAKIKRIESNKVIHEVDGFIFSVDVWYDESIDEYWFAYYDICKCINFNRRAGEAYYATIDEHNKNNFMDENYVNNFGFTTPEERSFITHKALIDLIERNNKRNDAFIKFANNIVCATEFEYTYDFDNIIDDVNLLKESLDKKDYEGILKTSYKITHSDEGIELLDRMGIVDKEIEQTANEIRSLLYDECRDDWEVNVKLCKREGVNEAKKEIYKKCKDSKSKTKVPDWIKNIIK